MLSWVEHEKSLIVGFLIFMTKWNFMLSWAEHEKGFITSGPGHHAQQAYLINTFDACQYYLQYLLSAYSLFSQGVFVHKKVLA